MFSRSTGTPSSPNGPIDVLHTTTVVDIMERYANINLLDPNDTRYLGRGEELLSGLEDRLVHEDAMGLLTFIDSNTDVNLTFRQAAFEVEVVNLEKNLHLRTDLERDKIYAEVA